MTAAATPIRSFLPAPLDSAGRLAPPKLNVGADPTTLDDSLCCASAVFNGVSAAAAAGRSNKASAPRVSCRARAGAGALAAPLPNAAAFDAALAAGVGDAS